MVPLIGFLESIAIAKAFARKNRYTVDASQELIALGIANCVSSFVSSYPVTGSFSRTAVNAQSGVATPAGGKQFVSCNNGTCSILKGHCDRDFAAFRSLLC